MIERLIENWLNSSNERGYEVAFCQLLMAEGYDILYLNRHSVFEQGKDIIAIDTNGQLCAFQLKGGNISLSRWRDEIKREIDELIELPVEYPGRGVRHAKPFLVTNGKISEEVVNRIGTLNNGNINRGFQPLECIEGRFLAGRFVKCHGKFLPQEPAEFEDFLRLFLADGRDLLPKEQFSRFVEAQFGYCKSKSTLQILRMIASTVVLAAYALSPYERNSNHFALFEGWTIVSAGILRLVEQKRVARKHWTPSYELTSNEAKRAMTALVLEALERDQFLEGEPMMDGGPPIRARITIIVGIAAATALVDKESAQSTCVGGRVAGLIERHLKQMLLWGESAIPYFVTTALWLESRGASQKAEDLIANLVEQVVGENCGREKLGVPSPYYNVAQCIAVLCGVGRDFRESDCPSGYSYSCQALIEFLVRRGRFNRLSAIWRDISEVQMCEMQFPKRADYLAWHNKKGRLRQEFYTRPQSRAALVRTANDPNHKALPNALSKDPSFAILFMLVYPHRFGRDLLKTIERGLQCMS